MSHAYSATIPSLTYVRQFYLKHGPLVHLTVYRNAAVMSADNRLSNCQTETSTRRSIGRFTMPSTIKRIEDVSQIIFGDALPVINHLYDGILGLPIKLERYFPIWSRTPILHSVVEQNEHQLREPLLI